MEALRLGMEDLQSHEKQFSTVAAAAVKPAPYITVYWPNLFLGDFGM